MKILTVAFMLLFNYLDTLPKLYHLYIVTHLMSSCSIWLHIYYHYGYIVWLHIKYVHTYIRSLL